MDTPVKHLNQTASAAPTPVEAPRIVLVSAMRNESPFLLEWVAYHKVIGIDQIVICANPSDDGTDDLLAALAEAGQIIYLPTNPDPEQSPLEAALAAFEANAGYSDGTWYLWLDADEFLNVTSGDHTVSTLLAALGPAQGIMLNWRLFGSNGHDRFPGRFIDASFSRASRPDFVGNLETKPLFRKSAAITGFARIGQERPALAQDHGLGADDFLGGNGKPLLADEPRTIAWLAGDPPGRTNLSARKERGAAFAQINHYAVRTPEFFQLKRLRGRGFLKAGHTTGHVRYTDQFFSRFDRNEAEDRSILHWQPKVTEEIALLLRNPSIANAAAASAALVKDIMANLNGRETSESDPIDLVQAEQPSSAPFKLTFPRLERRFVTAAYVKAETILEYGSGGSTVLAAQGGSQVLSVESDKAWADRLADHLAGISDKAQVHYADIGPTGDWGVPTRARFFGSFHRYALSVWDRPDFRQPDLVLIDGRFRAACLAAVRLRATKATTVLFDDYTERRYYHGVERLAVKEQVVGRMARFTVTPGPIPPEMMTEVIGWFTDPR